MFIQMVFFFIGQIQMVWQTKIASRQNSECVKFLSLILFYTDVVAENLLCVQLSSINIQLIKRHSFITRTAKAKSKKGWNINLHMKKNFISISLLLLPLSNQTRQSTYKNTPLLRCMCTSQKNGGQSRFLH